MKFSELFDSRDKKKRLSHVKNLVAIACSDGVIDNFELELIFKIGINAGLSSDELHRIIQRPGSINFFPPDSSTERIEQLYDLVMVMMVDGKFHKNEIALCKLIAIKLGFSHIIIDKIVQNTVELIAKGIATDIALAQLHEILE